MSHLLLYYQRPEPATWVFLSTFLLFGLYFVFHRFWSLRNLDLLLLVLLAPGLMMVYEGRKLRLDSHAVSVGKLASQQSQSPHQVPSRGQAPFSLVALQGDLSNSPSLANVAPASINAAAINPAAINAADAEAARVDSAARDATEDSEDSDTPLYDNTPTRKWKSSELEFYGFAWLLTSCGLLMIRMLVDPAIVRRPLLEPNLSIGGLSFIGISLLVFLMANIITSDPNMRSQQGPQLGPGYSLLKMLPELPTTPDMTSADWASEKEAEQAWLRNLARIVAIFANLAIVLGIIGVGYWHFDNIKTGIGAATMYLLLPYTAQMTGNVEHALPAAMLVLAILSYRLPLLAGLLLGFGAGLVYYPLFLLPLWISFYWHRGLGRLLSGICISLAILATLLLLRGYSAFLSNLQEMFGVWLPLMVGLEGIWGAGVPAYFRLPVLVGFFLLSASFAFWPARKTLGTLMCGTAAVMLAAQFWHGYGGGLYMAWFLPSVLLTIFRPNVDDRIASKVVRPNWRGTTRPTAAPTTAAVAD